MELEILISYNGLKAGRYQRVFYEEVTVEIPEYDGRDAPVAARWRDDPVGSTRWIAGRHFRPHRAATVAGAGTPSFRSVLQGCTHTHVSGLTDGYPIFDYHGNPATFRPERIGEIDPAVRDAAIALAHEWAGTIAVVDGEVMVACAEPHFVVSDWGYEVETRTPSATNAMRPDRRELKLSALGSARRADDPPGDMSIEVLIPESIRMDVQRLDLIHAARLVLGDYDFKRFTEVDTRLALALLPLIDAVNDKDDSEVDVESVHRLLPPVIEAMRRFESNPYFISAEKMDAYASAVERWETKPVEIEHIVPVMR